MTSYIQHFPPSGLGVWVVGPVHLWSGSFENEPIKQGLGAASVGVSLPPRGTAGAQAQVPVLHDLFINWSHQLNTQPCSLQPYPAIPQLLLALVLSISTDLPLLLRSCMTQTVYDLSDVPALPQLMNCGCQLSSFTDTPAPVASWHTLPKRILVEKSSPMVTQYMGSPNETRKAAEHAKYMKYLQLI